jgi:P pilus assembly chaperone PapD
MQKVGVYLTLLVAGALIGASIVGYITINQNPSIEEQVKVTIQGIQYETSDSVLKIELLNDAPEKNLEGKVLVSQDENQWTSEVTWYYTGYGVAEVTCDSINETQNFRITYTENNPKATYLDREIKWNEITIDQGSTSSQAGAVLSPENVRFYTSGSTDRVEIVIRNSGTSDATVAEVYRGTSASDLQQQSSVTYDPSSRVVAEGSSIKITFNYNWASETRYYFNVVTEEGMSIPFSEEAPHSTSIPFMETSELTITELELNIGAPGSIVVHVTNSGTSSFTVKNIRVNGEIMDLGDWSSGSSDTVAPGASETFTITHTVAPGSKYAVSLYDIDGTLVGAYTATA